MSPRLNWGNVEERKRRSRRAVGSSRQDRLGAAGKMPLEKYRFKRKRGWDREAWIEWAAETKEWGGRVVRVTFTGVYVVFEVQPSG